MMTAEKLELEYIVLSQANTLGSEPLSDLLGPCDCGFGRVCWIAFLYCACSVLSSEGQV